MTQPSMSAILSQFYNSGSQCPNKYDLLIDNGMNFRYYSLIYHKKIKINLLNSNLHENIG